MNKLKSKTIRLLLSLSVLATPLLPGCSDPNQPKLEQPFYLPAGSTIKIAGQKLTLRFDEVISDSRCPSNANCTWEGEAKCAVALDDGTPTSVTLTVPGLTWDYTEYKFKKYTLAFKLDPYPTLGEEILPSDYRLLMIVTITK